MGQLIRVAVVPMGRTALYDTDRSITGQDGYEFASLEEAVAVHTFPGALATRIFEADEAIDSVYVLSNQVVVRRAESWTDEQLEQIAEVIRTFFIFYEQNRDAIPGQEGAQEEPADSEE